MKNIFNHIRNNDLQGVINELEAGTNVNTKGWDNSIPLHYAVKLGHLGIVKELIGRGAYVDAKDYNNKTPLHYAVDKDYKKIITELIDKATDYNGIDEEKLITYSRKYYRQGRVKYDNYDYNEAIKNFDKAIELDPNDWIAYKFRGITNDELGKYQEAIKDYDKIIELNPKNSIAYNNRGYAKNNCGKYEEAIKDFDMTIELNPKHSTVYSNRGYAKAKLEKYEEAIKDFEKAIEISPKVEYFNDLKIIKGMLSKSEEKSSVQYKLKNSNTRKKSSKKLTLDQW